jgi:NTP pyrophosphatase (non-canonical NTP hydrolase)
MPVLKVDSQHKAKFQQFFSIIQYYCYGMSRDKGFWESDNPGEKIALMHSELSEALEAIRKGNPESKKIPGFTHSEEELADCVIRIMDFAGYFGLDLAEAIIAKIEHNASRPHKHGKKF